MTPRDEMNATFADICLKYCLALAAFEQTGPLDEDERIAGKRAAQAIVALGPRLQALYGQCTDTDYQIKVPEIDHVIKGKGGLDEALLAVNAELAALGKKQVTKEDFELLYRVTNKTQDEEEKGL